MKDTGEVQAAQAPALKEDSESLTRSKWHQDLPHPKGPTQVFMEAGDLALWADETLEGIKPAEGMAHIKKILDEMTPVERLSIVNSLSDMSEYSPKDKKTPDTGSIGELKSVERDANGDVKSITFVGRSTDDFGKEMTVSLDHKRTDEGANTREFKLADGTLRVVEYDGSGDKAMPIAIQDSNGTYLAKQADGSWIKMDPHGNSDGGLHDVTVNADGSLNFTATDGKNTITAHETVEKQGDTVDDVQFQIAGQTHQGQMRWHYETHRDADNKLQEYVEEQTASGEGREHKVRITRAVEMGRTTIEDENSIFQKTPGAAEPMKIVNKAGGQITFTPKLDSNDNVVGGSIDATFPDGFKKHTDDLSLAEWNNLQTATAAKAIWQPDHHFTWATEGGDSDSAEPKKNP